MAAAQTSIAPGEPIRRFGLHAYKGNPARLYLLSSLEASAGACGDTQTDILFTALSRELLRRRVEVPGVDLADLAQLTAEERREYGIDEE
jgi:hypothetical protein